MKHTGIRRVFRGLLAVSVALPFIVFSKATLMTLGGPLVWLLGYPLLVVVLLAATAERKRTTRVHATPELAEATEASDTVSNDERDQLRKRWIMDPAFSYLGCNMNHRD